MSDILELKASIDRQLLIHEELIKAELEKANELKKQSDELERNNKLRTEHNKALNELITEIRQVLETLKRLEQQKYFENIYDFIELLIPILIQLAERLNLNAEWSDKLATLAKEIGKKEINIKEIKTHSTNMGEKINYNDSNF